MGTRPITQADHDAYAAQVAALEGQVPALRATLQEREENLRLAEQERNEAADELRQVEGQLSYARFALQQPVKS